MKKFMLVLAVFGMASVFTACGDDSSTSSGNPTENPGGKGGSGKVCINTFTDGEQRCITGSNVSFLCGGTSSSLKSSVLADACPENPTATCPDLYGDGATLFYTEGADCHTF